MLGILAHLLDFLWSLAREEMDVTSDVISASQLHFERAPTSGPNVSTEEGA